METPGISNMLCVLGRCLMFLPSFYSGVGMCVKRFRLLFPMGPNVFGCMLAL